MIASRSLDELLPQVRELAQAFTARCAAEGIDVLITSTYRDRESQAAAYAQGRTAPGRVVTNAKPGESFHQFRCAFDFCPLVNGKCAWDDVVLFERVGSIAEALGLEWAGRWRGALRESAHVQWTAGLTLAELQAGQRPPAAAQELA